MSTNITPNPSIPYKREPQTVAKSKANWLGRALFTVRVATASAEMMPFPYVKGVFATITTVLEAAQKVRKSRDILKELCEDIAEITIIVRDKLSQDPDKVAGELEGPCKELDSILQDVLITIQKMQKTRYFLKEMFTATEFADEIAGYQAKIKKLVSNILLVTAIKIHDMVAKTGHEVHEIHEAVRAGMVSNEEPIAEVARSINTCPAPSRIFHGRQATLDQMSDYFKQDNGNQLVYLLHGLGGSGKTQLALKFISQSASQFSDIFLVDTSTTETVESSLKSIAIMKSAGTTAEDALLWFTSKHEKWLLLFDNADDPNINLNTWLPQCNHGNIIITSRNPELHIYAGISTQVSNMPETDAVVLLLKAGKQEMTSENEKMAAEIVKVLYCLPLAIVQAGAFIAKFRSMESYLNIFHENRDQVLRERPVQSYDNYSRTVYTTWQISFDRLSQPATMFLQLCSFLHHSGISEDIFRNASRYNFPTHGPTREELQQPLEFLSYFLKPNGLWQSSYFLNIRTELESYSLINFEPSKNLISIHPLVHEWTRETLIDHEANHSCSIALIGMCVNTIPERDMDIFSLKILPHVNSVLRENPETFPAFLESYGMVYAKAGKSKQAENLQVLVLERWKALLGEDHSVTLTCMNDLACTHRALGKFREGAELHGVVLEKRMALLGEDHPSTLTSMNYLASMYRDLGKLKEAAELQVVVLEKHRTVLGADHSDTQGSMNDLALIYRDLGKFKEAEELQVVVLEKRRTLLGADHPGTLISMNNLALTYHDLGKFQESAELLVTVLQKWKTLQGEDHPHTLLSMNNLAFTYNKLGKYKEAAELQAAALQKRKMVLGEDHPHTLSSMNHLAMSYNSLGKSEEAAELQVTALQKQKTHLGEDHPRTLLSMNILASIYRALGKSKEAAELQTAVIKKRGILLGPDHPDTLTSMNDLAMSYYDLGRSKEAADLQASVLEKRRTLLGEDHPDTLTSMNNLALIYRALSNSEEH